MPKMPCSISDLPAPDVESDREVVECPACQNVTLVNTGPLTEWKGIAYNQWDCEHCGTHIQTPPSLRFPRRD